MIFVVMEREPTLPTIATFIMSVLITHNII